MLKNCIFRNESYKKRKLEINNEINNEINKNECRIGAGT